MMLVVQAAERERPRVGGSAHLAAMSAFSQQLMCIRRGHEPLPLLLSFSYGGSNLRGKRDESWLEPSPRTRGYANL
jgi:hypothetical protein